MNNCSDNRNIRLSYKALAYKEWGNLFPHGTVGDVVGDYVGGIVGAYKALAHKEWGNLFPHGTVGDFVVDVGEPDTGGEQVPHLLVALRARLRIVGSDSSNE